MKSSFYSNFTDIKFIDKLKENLDLCQSFCFSVSFIKKPGLRLISGNIVAALERGAKGRIITSTYQNFTDVDSLLFFYDMTQRYPDRFSCHLDRECFHDSNGSVVGFHSKGYLFEFHDHREILVGSSNITVYALLKNVEWDVAVIDNESNHSYDDAQKEFEYLWERTPSIDTQLIDEYKSHLYYSIERWDMDYNVANADVKPNYMQRRALKELNRMRAMGATKALIVASAGSGKTYLSAFDAMNFGPKRLLYIVHEGSILMKSFETFQKVFGNERSYGIYNVDNKEQYRDFVFSTNVSMANSLELFDKHEWDYIIIDECHHASAETYQKILNYFEPEFLLGITATPERMDGEDIFGIFDQNVPYELRLRDAIIHDLIVPFKYYGIRDELIEYGIKETKGHKFVEQFSDDAHCEFICKMIEEHRMPGQKLKALAFCRDISHAIRMSQALNSYYKTAYLTGRNTVGERIRTYNELQNDQGEYEILFTVDILNEGVDIPGVNMVIFLRPTDSQTIFIQQLGRGLRKYEGKQYVTVLDFIGNDYKRSVQIAFALGSLAENFVLEKDLIAELVKDDYSSIGLEE
ncbi:DEAD/DEAH box helicase family protein [Butyrivibrio sp. XPD2002]|uniref:DEAD/DEAH box helicase family protein n=1 Tax=Butyrivibrio sp. XPD2002 TaxID=1280665 RepID=UPI000401CA44|nr:DEAD/DEAH box helicase family protein [Butyrivibrio sp. XPD2002]